MSTATKYLRIAQSLEKLGLNIYDQDCSITHYQNIFQNIAWSFYNEFKMKKFNSFEQPLQNY